MAVVGVSLAGDLAEGLVIVDLELKRHLGDSVLYFVLGVFVGGNSALWNVSVGLGMGN